MSSPKSDGQVVDPRDYICWNGEGRARLKIGSDQYNVSLETQLNKKEKQWIIEATSAVLGQEMIVIPYGDNASSQHNLFLKDNRNKMSKDKLKDLIHFQNILSKAMKNLVENLKTDSSYNVKQNLNNNDAEILFVSKDKSEENYLLRITTSDLINAESDSKFFFWKKISIDFIKANTAIDLELNNGKGQLDSAQIPFSMLFSYAQCTLM